MPILEFALAIYPEEDGDILWGAAQGDYAEGAEES